MLNDKSIAPVELFNERPVVEVNVPDADPSPKVRTGFTPDLSLSTPGNYTITNTLAAAAGCNAVTATFAITITAAPIATFNYSATPYCKNGTNPSPTFTGGGVAGTFTSTAGLSINASTGTIDLANSTAGTYTVTNTIVA